MHQSSNVDCHLSTMHACMPHNIPILFGRRLLEGYGLVLIKTFSRQWILSVLCFDSLTCIPLSNPSATILNPTLHETVWAPNIVYAWWNTTVSTTTTAHKQARECYKLHICFTVLNFIHCISLYKSPGFYFLPSIPDPAFKQGRPLIQDQVFILNREEKLLAFNWSQLSLDDVQVIFCWYYVLVLSCAAQKLYGAIRGHSPG